MGLEREEVVKWRRRTRLRALTKTLAAVEARSRVSLGRVRSSLGFGREEGSKKGCTSVGHVHLHARGKKFKNLLRDMYNEKNNTLEIMEEKMDQRSGKGEEKMPVLNNVNIH